MRGRQGTWSARKAAAVPHLRRAAYGLVPALIILALGGGTMIAACLPDEPLDWAALRDAESAADIRQKWVEIRDTRVVDSGWVLSTEVNPDTPAAVTRKTAYGLIYDDARAHDPEPPDGPPEPRPQRRWNVLAVSGISADFYVERSSVSGLLVPVKPLFRGKVAHLGVAGRLPGEVALFPVELDTKAGRATMLAWATVAGACVLWSGVQLLLALAAVATPRLHGRLRKRLGFRRSDDGGARSILVAGKPGKDGKPGTADADDGNDGNDGHDPDDGPDEVPDDFDPDDAARKLDARQAAINLRDRRAETMRRRHSRRRRTPPRKVDSPADQATAAGPESVINGVGQAAGMEGSAIAPQHLPMAAAEPAQPDAGIPAPGRPAAQPAPAVDLQDAYGGPPEEPGKGR